MTTMRRRLVVSMLTMVLQAAGSGPGLAQVGAPASGAPGPSAGAPGAGQPDSPWYLERGTTARQPGPLDEIPSVALELAAGLRDGGVPGFFDGQFKSTAGRFDELAAVAAEPSMQHVLRIMAVMAMQEAASGESLATALAPLLLSPEQEFGIELQAWNERFATDDPALVLAVRAADLSQHARFALAKDGQPDAVLEKIRVMEHYIHRDMAMLLDPSIPNDYSPTINFKRQVIFDIGYHYQQFDDFVHAGEWFHKLCDALPGMRETRWAHYNLACIAALSNRPEEALAHLRSAYAVGFTDVAWMLEDGDLASLRERPDFLAVVEDMRNLSAATTAPPAAGGAYPPAPLAPADQPVAPPRSP